MLYLILLTLVAVASANTGLNTNPLLPLPKAANAFVDVFGNNSLFLRESDLGLTTGVTYAFIYSVVAVHLALVVIIILYLIGKVFSLHRNPLIIFLSNIFWFLLLVALTSTSWFLPTLTNAYFFTVTGLITLLTLLSFIWMLYAFIKLCNRYRKVKSLSVALRGDYALMSGDKAISLTRPEVYIVVTKRPTDSYWTYDGIPLPTLELLMLVTSKGCYSYTRLTDAATTHTPTKAKLYILSNTPMSEHSKLTSVTSDDL